MYKIRRWAHDTARENNFNPWGPDEKKEKVQDPNTLPDEEQNQGTTPIPSQKTNKSWVARLVDILRTIFLRSWLNVLLIFVPAGIAVHAAGLNPNVSFALNAIAVVPLAGLLTFATECLAHRTSPTIAALLNVSFGNSVELIIFIVALIQKQIRIVQASLVGSILANLLLILGMSMTIGGLKYQEQIYDSLVTQMSSSCLVLASLSLLIPTVFHASFSDQNLADQAVLKISRGTSIILLLIYVLYLLFQLKSHAYMYEGTPQHVIDEQTQPGILQRRGSSSSSSSSSVSRSSSVASHDTASSGHWRHRVKRKAKKLGHRRSPKVEESTITEEDDISAPDRPSTSTAQIPPASNTLQLAEKPTMGEFTASPMSEEPPALATIPSVSTTPAVPLPRQTSTPIPRQSSTPLQVSASTPAAIKRPSPLARGITIRPPPVFRKESAFQQQSQLTHRYPTNQMRRFNSTPNMATAGFTQQENFTAPTRPRQRTTTGLSSQTGMPVHPVNTEDSEPPIGLKTSILLLLGSTALVAICAEFMVSSIEHLVETSPLSEAFVGLIILPIVGNAAEHVTAVVVASKNKLDLALAVSLGSSIQIALFITPLVVLIGWMANIDMTLYFTLFETVALFGSVFIVCFLCLDGRSNYLEGALLCSVYIILAVGAYFFPDSEGQNSFVGGTGDGPKRMLLRDL